MEQDEEDRLRALRSIEAELRAAMEESRGKYEEAKAIFEEASEQAFQIGLDSADGPHAIFKATQHFNMALKRYSDALQRFAAFLLDHSLHPNRK